MFKNNKKEVDQEILKIWQELENVKKLAAMNSGGTNIDGDLIIQLTQRIEKLEIIVNNLQNALTNLSNKVRANTSTINFQDTKDTVGDDALKEINMRLNNLANDVENLKKEFARWMKELQD